MRTLIKLSNANIVNGEAIVVYEMNMEIREGDFVYLVGKVGTGKTSIIRTLIAENPFTKGTGEVCGFDLRFMKAKEIPFLRSKIGVVFQDFQLLMDRTVTDNLSFVLKATGWKDKVAISRRIDEVLSAVGMTTKAHKMPHQLSGGEQQRIAIARTILNDPELIIADEPTGNLDAETSNEIMALLCKLNKERGTAVLMVTHNLSICGRYPGRVFECKNEACVEI